VAAFFGEALAHARQIGYTVGEAGALRRLGLALSTQAMLSRRLCSMVRACASSKKPATSRRWLVSLMAWLASLP
jgi:hypothetical protein